MADPTIAERRRAIAMDMAIRHLRHKNADAAAIVATATEFDKFLKGDTPGRDDR